MPLRGQGVQPIEACTLFVGQVNLKIPNLSRQSVGLSWITRARPRLPQQESNTSTPPMEEDHPLDTRLLDGYRLIRFLGRGGFGEVWLCRSEAMGDFRAIKIIPITHAESLEKEYEALLHFRKAAARLRSPHLVSIEHVGRNEAGLYYVMPLADGVEGNDPFDPAWQPLSLTAKIHAQVKQRKWFSSQEITAIVLPILQALQTLTDAGLVHRDVKPENILFFNGQPCLGDISLLGADASVITRRGTPGYGTPSWYVGGHPDMYGIAATLYTLLTNNLPDKMGRSAFLWPPQGEASLTEAERAEWKRLHAVIRRATDEKVAERFVDFVTMAGTLRCDQPVKSKLPRVLISALTLTGVAAATVFAGFRSKQVELPVPPPTGQDGNGQASKGNEQLPALTEDQKADYKALAGMIQGYIGDREYANALASVETLLSTYPQARTQPAYSIARAMALKGLGRVEEAKEELRKDIHLSPQITPMATRKDMWVEFGDLEEAENDLTRILNKFGPNSFTLFLRADIRAQRGNFAGVLADKQAAFAYKPEEPEQQRLVDAMWAPLETKYPGYAAYLKTLPEK
jgi:serine/threonine protein kinase